MKRYELTLGGNTMYFYGDTHNIDRQLQMLTIICKGEVVCQAGISGMILVVRDEEYLKNEQQMFLDRAKRMMRRYEKENETMIDKIKKYFKI